MNRDQIPGVIIGKLMNIGGMLQRHGNKMLQPYDLTHQQFSIFFEIAKIGKVRQKDIVNRLMLEKSHVSKVIKKLDKMGLIIITETEDDKRASWVTTTPKGDEVVTQCSEMFAQWHEEWVDEVDGEELATILDSLTTLQTIFSNKTG